MLTWRVYYDSGATFDDSMGMPWQSPRDGAVGVVQADATYGREMLEGDYFIFRKDTGKWSFHDRYGLMDQIIAFAPAVVAVRAGRYVTNEQWNAIKIAMINDPDFPPRSADNPNVLR